MANFSNFAPASSPSQVLDQVQNQDVANEMTLTMHALKVLTSKGELERSGSIACGSSSHSTKSKSWSSHNHSLRCSCEDGDLLTDVHSQASPLLSAKTETETETETELVDVPSDALPDALNAPCARCSDSCARRSDSCAQELILHASRVKAQCSHWPYCRKCRKAPNDLDSDGDGEDEDEEAYPEPLAEGACWTQTPRTLQQDLSATEGLGSDQALFSDDAVATNIPCHQCAFSPLRVKWKKILYTRQPYPDNYVDSTFMSSLILNHNLRRYRYSHICKATVALTQHLSFVIIFIIMYRMILHNYIDTNLLVGFNIWMLPIGYSLRWLLHPTWEAAIEGLKSSVIVFGVLRILTPVLQTLTQSFSDDTVISLTTIFLLIHIAFNDYSFISRNPNSLDERSGRLISLNAALLANVLLASRLETSTDVFAFVFFGIEIFALSPLARRHLKTWNSTVFTYLLTPLLTMLTALLLCIECPISLVILYIFSMFFISFIGPYWFICSQKYKSEIKGPWDIPCIPSYT